MRSTKQIEASRANGRRSLGPITEQGKRNSSRNSTRHGLLAQSVVLHTESQSRFLALLRELMDEYQPATSTQHILVETLAVTRWRICRNWEMQRSALEWDGDTNPGRNPQERAVRAMAEAGPFHCHQLLLRYEVALDRQFNKALHQLQKLQSANTAPAERPQQAPETKHSPTPEPPTTEPLKYASAPNPNPDTLENASDVGQVSNLRRVFNPPAGSVQTTPCILIARVGPVAHGNSNVAVTAAVDTPPNVVLSSSDSRPKRDTVL